MKNRLRVMISVLLIICQLFTAAYAAIAPQEAEAVPALETAAEEPVAETAPEAVAEVPIPTEEATPVISGIRLNCEANEILLGSKADCWAVVEGSGAFDPNYSLSFSGALNGEGIAVDLGLGLVSVVANGNPAVTDEVTVTVVNPLTGIRFADVNDLTLDAEEITLTVGEEINAEELFAVVLSGTVLGAVSGADMDITLTDDNNAPSAIALFNRESDPRTLKALEAGEAYLKAYDRNNSAIEPAVLKIVITEAGEVVTPAEDVNEETVETVPTEEVQEVTEATDPTEVPETEVTAEAADESDSDNESAETTDGNEVAAEAAEVEVAPVVLRGLVGASLPLGLTLDAEKTYSVSVSDETIAMAEIAEGVALVKGLSAGSVTVTVTVTEDAEESEESLSTDAVFYNTQDELDAAEKMAALVADLLDGEAVADVMVESVTAPTVDAPPEDIKMVSVIRGLGVNKVVFEVLLDVNTNKPDDTVKAYRLYRTTSNGGGVIEKDKVVTSAIPQERLTSTITELTYFDSGSFDYGPDVKYEYRVAAIDKKTNAETHLSDTKEAEALSDPAAPTLSVTEGYREVEVILDHSGGLYDRVALFRKNPNTGKTEVLNSTISFEDTGSLNVAGSLHYRDKNVQAGTDYDYSAAYLVPETVGGKTYQLLGEISSVETGKAEGTNSLPKPAVTLDSDYTSVTLKIKDPAKNNTTEAESYLIQRYEGSGYFYIIDEKNEQGPGFGQTLEVTFDDLEPGKTYYFSVRALSDSGATGSSNVFLGSKATAKIPAPTSVKVAKVGNAFAELTFAEPKDKAWLAYLQNTTRAVTYRLEYSKGDGAWVTWSQDVDSDIAEKLLSTGDIEPLDNNAAYSFRLRTVIDDKYFSGYSATVKGTPSFKAPVIKSKAVGPGSVQIVMKEYDMDGQGTFDHYRLEYKLRSAKEWTVFARTKNFTDSSEDALLDTISPLTIGTAYDFRVAVEDDQGNVSKYAAFSATIPNIKAPAGIKVTNGTTSVSFTWNAVAGATGYEIEYKKANETLWTPGATTQSPNAMIRDLESGEKYNFRIYTVVDLCDSLVTNTCNVTNTIKSAPALVNGAPAVVAPKNLKGNVTGFTSVLLSWTGQADSYYDVWCYPGPTTDDWEVVYTAKPGEFEASIEGLQSGVNYQFRVSPQLDAKKVSNTLKLNTKAVNAPTGLTVKPHNKTLYAVWKPAGNGITNYRVLVAETAQALNKVTDLSALTCDSEALADAGVTGVLCGDYPESTAADNSYKIGHSTIENNKNYTLRVYSIFTDTTTSTDIYSAAYAQAAGRPTFTAVKNFSVKAGIRSYYVTWAPHEDLMEVTTLNNTGKYKILVSNNRSMVTTNEIEVVPADVCSGPLCSYEVIFDDACDQGKLETLDPKASTFYFQILAEDDGGSGEGQYVNELGTTEISTVSGVMTSVLKPLTAPSVILATPGDKAIVLSWKPVEGVSEYQVFIKQSDELSYVEFTDNTPKLNPVTGRYEVVVDKKDTEALKNGVKYSLTLKSIAKGCAAATASFESQPTSPITIQPALASVTGLKRDGVGYGSFNLTWTNSGFAKYKVQMASSRNFATDLLEEWADVTENFFRVYSTSVGKAAISGIHTEDYGADFEENKYYFFRVIPEVDGAYSEAYASATVSMVLPVLPKPASLKNVSNKQLTWAPVNGVTHYQLWFKENGTSTFAKLVTDPIAAYPDTTKQTNPQSYVFAASDAGAGKTGQYYVTAIVKYDTSATGIESKPSNIVSAAR